MKSSFYLLIVIYIYIYDYKVKTLIANITQLPINDLINELKNSSNCFINIQLIKYILACFNVRDNL